MAQSDVRVSVCMVTYNQEKYIAQAIESVLMQKTEFKFQLIVGDDASTDKTTEIVHEYAEKYPDIIKPVFHKINVGPGNNSLSLYKKVDTEYVAICDGDDYWLDEYKIQKQVDFLDKNKDFNTVFTKSCVIREGEASEKKEYLPSDAALKGFYERGYLIPKDVIYYNDITPVTVMWRWQLKNGFPNWYSDKIMGDYALNMIHAKNSKIAFLPIITAVYRRHSQSIWSSIEHSNQRYTKYTNVLINSHIYIKKYYNGLYIDDFDYVIQSIFNKAIDIEKNEDNVHLYLETISSYPDLAMKREKQLVNYNTRNYSIYDIYANKKIRKIIRKTKLILFFSFVTFVIILLLLFEQIIWPIIN